MSQVAHSHKGKRSHNLKLTAEKNPKYNVTIQDFVIDYNHPKDSSVNPVNPKSAQKRKIIHDDWTWAPYPQRIKMSDNVFEDSAYLSDALDDSQIVPSWKDDEPDGNDLLFCEDDDSSDSKSTDIHIITIDEVIEFDDPKSPTGHDYEEEPISFDMEALCENFGSENGNGKDLTIDKQEIALNMLLAFTNIPRLVPYEGTPPKSKEIKQMEPLGDLCDSNKSSQPETTSELENDRQIEEFKFARCFKCRRKVYTMQDCPRHLMKGVKGEMVKNK